MGDIGPFFIPSSLSDSAHVREILFPFFFFWKRVEVAENACLSVIIMSQLMKYVTCWGLWAMTNYYAFMDFWYVF